MISVTSLGCSSVAGNEIQLKLPEDQKDEPQKCQSAEVVAKFFLRSYSLARWLLGWSGRLSKQVNKEDTCCSNISI